jgi:6-pyruvoyltetrahydropterin/6-carboxytetrahydropterin synthase
VKERMNENNTGTYTVTVIRDFIARHFLTGGDWGAENEEHAHHYKLELTLEGAHLDRHNYLVDIVAIEAALDAFVGRYGDALLNEMPAFADTNPSIELFSRVAFDEIVPAVAVPGLSGAVVTMWEHDTAKASYAATF